MQMDILAIYIVNILISIFAADFFFFIATDFKKILIFLHCSFLFFPPLL